jgi:ubiquinone/menaquinone biosynthesis C-methylase UbiE
MVNALRSIKRRLGDQQLRRLRIVAGPILRAAEGVAFGGGPRRSILRALWLGHLQSSIRRDLIWAHPDHDLHFSTTTETFNLFANSAKTLDFQNFNRAFFAGQMIRSGDRVLDIGCGEGFFTKRFYSCQAAHVDALDIEHDAIVRARRRNSDAKVNYFQADAVTTDFPSPSYDVIVWDGALGHFAPDVTDAMLLKIKRYLRTGGVFVGSESLGHGGGDHLQFWDSLEDLGRLFKRYFATVQLTSATYGIGEAAQQTRVEAYWRCGDDSARIREAAWKPF